jgi:hypothetical protein
MGTIVLNRVLLESVERGKQDILEFSANFRILLGEVEESKKLSGLMNLINGDKCKMILISEEAP